MPRKTKTLNNLAILMTMVLSILLCISSLVHADPERIRYQDTSDEMLLDTDQDPRAFTGKPISLVSGAETIKRTDLTIGNLYPITIERQYISKTEYDSPVGYGWALSYDKRLYTLSGDGAILLRQGPGKKQQFQLYNGQYAIIHYLYPSCNCYPLCDCSGYSVITVVDQTISLVKNADGTYTLTTKNGDREQYDSLGRLMKMQNAAGNSLVFYYELDSRSPLWGVLPASIDQSTSKIIAYDYRISRIEEQDAAGNFTNRFVLLHYDTATGRLTDIVDSAGRTVTYGHDAIGNLISVTGLAGNSAYGYTDATRKHLVTTIDEGNGVYTNTYDTLGWVGKQTHGTGAISLLYNQVYKSAIVYTTVNDSAGNSLGPTVTRTLAFDNYGHLTKETDNFRNETRYTRTYQGWPTREEHWEYTSSGLVLRTATDFTYDEMGNMLTKTEAQGTAVQKTTAYTYHPVFNLVTTETVSSVIDPTQSRVVTNIYDNATGNLLTKTETGLLDINTAFTYTTTYTYDSNGRITSIDGPRTDVNDITTYTYDPVAGFLTSVTQPVIGTTTYSNFDPLGNPQTVTDPNGNVTAYTYDSIGRVSTVKASGDTNPTQYFYTSGGCSSCGGGASNRIDHITLPEGNTIWYTYDSMGNLSTIKDSLSNTINYTYDSEGNKLTEQIKDSSGTLQKSLSYSYDALNRLSKITNPDANYTQFTYDALGNRKTVKDPKGNTSTYNYDALNRLTSVISAGTYTTSYGYNTNNNLTSVTDANNNTTQYKYDDKGRVYQTISPDTGTTTYGYDPAGNMVSKTDAKGVTISYVCDAANRLTKIDFPTDTDIVYAYDSCVNGKGRLCSMTDASGTTAYEYTPKGQVKKETKTVDSVQYVTQYTYDQNGNLKTMTYPSGRVITYNYSNDRAVSVLNNAANLATNINYKPFGGMYSITYGNGLAGSISYDNQYRVTSITAGTVMSLSYPTYDANGNIMAINDTLDPTKNKSFTYDNLDRLSTASSTGIWGNLGWTYDGVGNRQTENSTVYTYYPNTNKLSGAGGISFNYDNNGNTTTETSRSYTYNQNQRLIQAVNGATTANYTYNGNGQRVKKVVNGTTTVFHYDQRGQLIAESDGTGAPTAEYVYLNRAPIAKIESGNVYYYANDHIGTPQRMMDSTGDVVWSADYKPFGEATITVSTITNNLRFPGQYSDTETGLYQNWWRDYNLNGRYNESDPLNIGSLSLFRRVSSKKALKIYTMDPQRQHLYLYALSNPIRKIDPTGRNCLVHLLKELVGEYVTDKIADEIAGGELEPDCGECVLSGSSTYGKSKFCFYKCYDEHGEPESGEVAVPVKSCPPGPCPDSWMRGQMSF